MTRIHAFFVAALGDVPAAKIAAETVERRFGIEDPALFVYLTASDLETVMGALGNASGGNLNIGQKARVRKQIGELASSPAVSASPTWAGATTQQAAFLDSLAELGLQLYPTAVYTNLIISDCRLPGNLIEREGSPQKRWTSLIAEAVKHKGMIKRIVGYLLRNFPNDKQAIALHNQVDQLF